MAIKSLIKKLRDRVLHDYARREDFDRLYDNIAGLLQIQNAMSGAPVLKPMRGWAISPDAMAWLLADLQERERPTVIEFGSGQSTIIFAAALRKCGGRLISVEHDAAYCDTIRRQLTACGLAGGVEFIHCPLADGSGSPSIRSYDVKALPDMKVDVALIDGPPYFNGSLTRLPPLRWAVTHLNTGGSVYLDDAVRGNETECLRLITSEHPGLKRIEHRAEKGLMELCFAEEALRSGADSAGLNDAS